MFFFASQVRWATASVCALTCNDLVALPRVKDNHYEQREIQYLHKLGRSHGSWLHESR